jgi:tetratricopeptide (TPR) repeat protein
MKVILAVALVLVAFKSSPTYAQNVDELNKLGIAQALEQAGEYEKALDFYRQLYQESPDNFVYFDGLRRTCMNLKRYDEAKGLLVDKLRSDPTNMVMMCQLGDAYFKNGQQDSAMAEWDKALTLDPKNPNTYRAVAGTMSDDRLFDSAVGVYRKGEANSNAVFTSEMSRLYFLDANYAGSLRELLKGLETRQAPFVLSNIEAQIGSYSSSKEAIEQFTSEMEKEAAAKPDDADYRRLLGFLYMQKKDYAAAYGTYKWLDEHSGSPGSELLQFASSAYNDEAYQVAASAYKEVAGISRDNSVIVQALAGNANSLQQMGEKDYAEGDRPCSTTDTLQEFSQALSVYEKIIEQYSDTRFLAPAVLNSVELKMEYFHDFSGAEKLLSDYSGRLRPLTNDWILLRIRLYMKEGKFQDAFSTALGSIQSIPAEVQKMSFPNDGMASLYDRIEYQAAVALYYMGLYDSSTFYLKKISSNPMSDAANDAIQLLNTITNNRGNPPALRQFASASFMEESDQTSQAVAELEKLLDEYSNVPLAENARFDLAADYCRMGNVAAALKNYSALADDSTGVFADRAEFRICRIYENTLHQSDKAIAEYENFLIRFPNSIYQDRVREILRGLLGDSS